jgi:hypothetical protein
VAGVLLLDKLHVAQDFGLVQLGQALVEPHAQKPGVNLVCDAAVQGVHLQEITQEAASLVLEVHHTVTGAHAALLPFFVTEHALCSNHWHQLITWC